MLELIAISKNFGSKAAVTDVNLKIDAREICGVIGSSGAGKSTLLRMINRLVEPSSGEIRWNGASVSTLSGSRLRAWRRDCAMIFQQFNLSPRLDVLTNVLLGRLNHRSTVASLLGLFGDDERLAALATLDRLGVAETALQRAGTLSGGQQQRVAIARALTQEPQLILADEPIASLDPSNAQIVMESLADINARDGIGVVVNLHTLDTAKRYCDRIIGMRHGAVVFDGPPSALTSEAVAAIYGVETIDENATSTALPDAA